MPLRLLLVLRQLCFNDHHFDRLVQMVTDRANAEVKHPSLDVPAHTAQSVSSKNLLIRVLRGLFRRHSATMLDFGDDCFALHDPAVIAYVLYPHLFTFKKLQVNIATGSDEFRGHSWTDTRGMVRSNAWVATDVNESKVLFNVLKDISFLAAQLN